MTSKKKNNIFFKILLCLFIVFAALMVTLQSGYYDAKKSSEVLLTESKIKEYEEKLKNNEPIDLNSYIEGDKKYYGNEVAEFGLKVTNEVEKVASSCFDTISKVLKTLF